MEFKVGDRVALGDSPEIIGTITGLDTRIGGSPRWFVVLDDGEMMGWGKGRTVSIMEGALIRHAPTTHTRGTHPNSLANLATGQERRDGEWEEKRLRLSTGACDWLRKQGRGNMSRAVERLIMREIEREES
jgi:hypothetical protein